MAEEYLACAFTGHRKIADAHIGNIDGLVFRAIEYMYKEGVRYFYAGGAQGFDTVAARQVILFKLTHPDVSLHLILPCQNQTDGWTKETRDMYDFVLCGADSVEYLEDSYTDGCMRRRNQRLVDLADYLVAYVNRTNSGSAQTVRMAQAKSIKVFNLYKSLDEQARK